MITASWHLAFPLLIFLAWGNCRLFVPNIVAGSVRKLASKSAEAAKQIKELAEIANKKSNDGLKISQQMTQSLELLDNKIASTTEIITTVSAATKEQMIGISQINEAIKEIDKATQENSGMTEEAEQVAEDVSILANKLVSDANTKQFTGKDTLFTTSLCQAILQ